MGGSTTIVGRQQPSSRDHPASDAVLLAMWNSDIDTQQLASQPETLDDFILQFDVASSDDEAMDAFLAQCECEFGARISPNAHALPK